MPEDHIPPLTDPRSYESEEGDILPLEIMVDPVQPRPDITEYPMVRTSYSELDSHGHPMIRQSLAKQAIRPEAAAGQEPQNDTLDPATAMRLMHKKVGFYARDADEKRSIQEIVGRSSEYPRPTLRYLYDVERHQVSLKLQDPSAAPRSIVRQFEQYAVQANIEARFTRFFESIIRNRKPEPDQKVTDIMTAEEYSNDEQTRRTLTSIVRILEADRFAEDGEGQYPLAVRHGVDSLKGKDRDEYVLSFLATLPLALVVRYNERLRVEENKRFEYWRSQIGEATIFRSVKDQAFESLAKLDRLRPPSR